LTIRLLASGAVQICWPSFAAGFALQETPSLNPPAWSPSVWPVSDDGVAKCVTVPGPTGERLFRLAK
jgi:hypothetical protein